MLTVAILKNGQPLMARSAVNRLKTEGVYVCDDGTRIEHDPKEGAVALAKKLLDTIVETPSEGKENHAKQLQAQHPGVEVIIDGVGAGNERKQENARTN